MERLYVSVLVTNSTCGYGTCWETNTTVMIAGKILREPNSDYDWDALWACEYAKDLEEFCATFNKAFLREHPNKAPFMFDLSKLTTEIDLEALLRSATNYDIIYDYEVDNSGVYESPWSATDDDY